MWNMDRNAAQAPQLLFLMSGPNMNTRGGCRQCQPAKTSSISLGGKGKFLSTHQFKTQMKVEAPTREKLLANSLEEVAADVSRRLEERGESGDPAPIRNLPGYVFHAFVRDLNRLKRKELVLVRDDGTGQVLSPRWADPSAQFEQRFSWTNAWLNAIL